MNTYENILVEQAGAVCTLTMNNPKSLNPLNMPTIREVSDALSKLEANPEVRIVIITGAGKAFVAGADIAEMSTLAPERARVLAKETQALYRQMGQSSKIFIAAINGFALGGGCEYALACDLRVASEKGKFGLPEVSLGILPGGGGTQRMPRLVGSAKAAELMFTADVIGAEEALAMGLVNSVVPAEELMAAAQKLAARILKNAPQAVVYAKRCLRQSEEGTLEAGLEYESGMFGMCFATADQKEGMNAFLEKRPAEFQKTL
jgi:Enoyl-CoA hydratase/carnithine racemase